MKTISMLINGEAVPAQNGATFTRSNPLDGNVATTAPAASDTDAIAEVAGMAAKLKPVPRETILKTLTIFY